MIIYPDLPVKALSVRQPWAWLIVNGFKGIENRSRSTSTRGPFAIHASQGMSPREYTDCQQVTSSAGITLPDFDELPRGGIVGVADLTGVTTSAWDNPWFFGPYGYVLTGQKVVDFIACKGALGFFDWRRNLPEAA